MSSEADNWKWWYYVVAGVLIGTFGVQQMFSGNMSKGVGSELMAALAIAIGLFSRQAQLRKTQADESERED